MALLRHRTHKELATKIIQTIVEGGTRISSVEKVSMLFRFISPLIRDADGGSAAADLDDEDIEEEQVLVAKLIHSLYNDDATVHHAILLTAKEELMPGGSRRTRHTLPALGFSTLQIVRRIAKASPPQPPSSDTDAPPVTAEVLLQVSVCHAVPHPFRLSTYLMECWYHLRMIAVGPGDMRPPCWCPLPAHDSPEADALSRALGVRRGPLGTSYLPIFSRGACESPDHHNICPSRLLCIQAFTLYEEGVSDQRHLVTALHSIIGTLQRCHVLGPENRDVLVFNAAAYASKLLKRSDQCKAVCSCSHLYWQVWPTCWADET